jgi:hypothetical protein
MNPPLVRSDGHRDAIDEENRIFAVYCARHRIDWRDFHCMGAAEVGLLRAEALANRHLYPIPVSEPGYLYHGTSKARLAHIKCQGLLPSERSRWTRDPFIGDWSLGKVFFSATVRMANFHAGQASKTRPALIRVPGGVLTDINPDPKEEAGNFYVERPVPPEHVEFWGGREWCSCQPVLAPPGFR